ncbi:MAG: hypothetical protein IPM54_10410 [Polyangiaceae bacterium]|nr:hypothetical protein [Polyangiaceae bacterium]
MAADRESYDMHLTSRGWIKGTSETGFGAAEVIPTPPDTVLTIQFNQNTSSIYSKPDYWVDVIFKSSDETAIAALKERFGARPPGFHRWG